MCSPGDVLLAILAIIFPPAPVWIKRGLCSADSLINLALCLLGFIPGLLHAWYIIQITPSTPYERVVDVERGQHAHGRTQQGQQPQRRVEGGLHGAVVKGSGKKSGYGAIAPQHQQGGSAQGHGGNASSSSAAGPAEQVEAPPSYVDVVGDHKVQSSTS